MTSTPTAPDQLGGIRGFVRRHPYVTFLLVFNTLGQAVAFVPVVAEKRYGTELDTELVLIVATLLFLLAPALVITRIARGGGALHDLIRAMLRFRTGAAWYLLPLVAVPVLTAVAALPAPPDLTARAALLAYLTVYLPALLLQFGTTNWWEETVWMGFFQGPLQHRFGPLRAALITAPFFGLQHISLAFGGTFAQGVIQFGLILLITVPVRALLGWAYNRTGSLALVGLIHAASNAAGLSLVPHLWHQPGGGGLALLVLGLLVMAATQGRLGWTAFRSHDPGAPGAEADTPRAAAVAGPARPIRED
jgi:membrane protease YdiL (CAAX protease family)